MNRIAHVAVCDKSRLSPHRQLPRINRRCQSCGSVNLRHLPGHVADSCYTKRVCLKCGCHVGLFDSSEVESALKFRMPNGQFRGVELRQIPTEYLIKASRDNDSRRVRKKAAIALGHRLAEAGGKDGGR